MIVGLLFLILCTFSFAYSTRNQKQTRMPSVPHSSPLLPGCPTELNSLRATTNKYNWFPRDPSAMITYSICDSIDVTCGESGQMCSTQPTGCSGMCQTWNEADGQVGVSLGNYSGYRKGDGVIQLVYTGGDVVQNGNPVGRNGYIWVSPGSTPLEPYNYVQASGHEPNQPYIYQLYVRSNKVEGCSSLDCTTCLAGGACSWCLDTNQCFNYNWNQTCQNYFNSSRYCKTPPPPPVPRCELFPTCNSCTGNASKSGCAWCLGQGLCDTPNLCTGGKVVSPKYCSL